MKLVLSLFGLLLLPTMVSAQQDLSGVTAYGISGINYTDEEDGISAVTIEGCTGSESVRMSSENVVSIETYEKHAKIVALLLKEQCDRMVNIARKEWKTDAYPYFTKFYFKVSDSSPPKGYLCASGTGLIRRACQFHLTVENDSVSFEHFGFLEESVVLAARAEKQKEREERAARKLAEQVDIRDFDDVIRLLLEGRFVAFKQYTMFMDYFHQDYLAAYSDACGSTIKPAEVRTLANVVTTSIGGVDVGSRQEGKTQTIYLEPRFAPQFDAKFKAENRFLVSKFGLNVARYVAVWQQNRGQIQRFLRRNTCGSERSKILLENLYRYSTGRQPLNS